MTEARFHVTIDEVIGMYVAARVGVTDFELVFVDNGAGHSVFIMEMGKPETLKAVTDELKFRREPNERPLRK
jgi:hypothetical protein